MKLIGSGHWGWYVFSLIAISKWSINGFLKTIVPTTTITMLSNILGLNSMYTTWRREPISTPSKGQHGYIVIVGCWSFKLSLLVLEFFLKIFYVLDPGINVFQPLALDLCWPMLVCWLLVNKNFPKNFLSIKDVCFLNLGIGLLWLLNTTC
jgi:hypothetical protein